MDRETLRAKLDKAGVDPASYSLDGVARDETYVLDCRSGAFAVFYSERRLRSGEATFAAEDDACRHLLGLLIRDSTTRGVAESG